MSAFSSFGSDLGITALIVFGVVMGLYLARAPMQTLLASSCRAVGDGLRFASRAAIRLREKLIARNREVLLAAGREASARMVEREFERFGDKVNRDLGEYPLLAQALAEKARRLDDDYAKSAAVPPSPPGWAEAVDAVAGVPAKADAVLRPVLESIHDSFRKEGERAADAYRDDCRQRHKRLHDMAPEWRESNKLLAEIRGRIDTVNERAASVDAAMDKYKEISSGTDKAADALQSSSFVQFFIAGLVLLIAGGGAVVNFHLIARPMSEMVGGNTFIGPFQSADIAALVIILVELSMGLFLMECLKITSLFPVVSALADKTRQRLAVVSFGILLSLACVEAGLAYMRELLLQDELATTAALRGDAPQQGAAFLWITTVAQMGMGFILPFALTFVAIPLETFIHSMRAVLGAVAASVLLAAAFAMRVLARMMDAATHILCEFYDVAIFAPLWVERRLAGARASADAPRTDPAASAPKKTKDGSAVGAKAVMEEAEERLAS